VVARIFACPREQELLFDYTCAARVCAVRGRAV